MLIHVATLLLVSCCGCLVNAQELQTTTTSFISANSSQSTTVAATTTTTLLRSCSTACSSQSEWNSSQAASSLGLPGVELDPHNDLRAKLSIPEIIRPFHYNIRLRPDFYSNSTSQFTLNGTVSIYMRCDVSSDVIAVNTRQLSVDSVSIYTSDGALLPFYNTSYSQETEIYSIKLQQLLRVGDVVIVMMSFHGGIISNTAGVYWSQYWSDGKRLYMVATQFESTDARRVFPCVDQPDVKSTFSLTVEHQQNYTALANTRLNYTVTLGDGWQADTFRVTPQPMSTYLVAFTVFQMCSVNTSSTLYDLHLWGPCNYTRDGLLNYSADVATKSFEFGQTYFNWSDPFHKSDLFVAPKVNYGGMENWGIISYQPSVLLYDPYLMDSNAKQHNTLIVTHEIMHMWVGDIVTCAWWDDIWLHEGAADYFQYLALEYVQPTWDKEQLFVASSLYSALSADDFGQAGPIYNSVLQNYGEIEGTFNTIVYKKGASVLRMLHRLLLGDEAFKRGYQIYIANHSYSTATHKDLVNALIQGAEQTGKQLDFNLTSLLNTWIGQPGFPLVTANRVPGSCTVNLTQRLYLYEPVQQLDPSPFGYEWEIAVSYITSCQPDLVKRVYMHRDNATLNLQQTLNADDWILINYNQYGFYRVNYDRTNWNALASQLLRDYRKITTINRAQLIDDSFTLARSWDLDQMVAFQLTEYMPLETEYLPWNALRMDIEPLQRLVYSTQLDELLTNYLVRILSPNYKLLGWNSTSTDSITTLMLRQLTLEMLCSLGHDDCVQTALDRFYDWRNGRIAQLNADERSVVYCMRARYGSDDDWKFLLRLYLSEPADDLLYDDEFGRRLDALSCTQNETRVSSLLNSTLYKTRPILRQDDSRLIWSLVRTPVGKQVAFNYVTSVSDINSLKSNANFSIMNALAYTISRPEELQQYESLVNRTNSDPSLFSKQLRVARDNVNWFRLYEIPLKNWINGTLSKPLPVKPTDAPSTTVKPTRVVSAAPSNHWAGHTVVFITLLIGSSWQ